MKGGWFGGSTSVTNKCYNVKCIAVLNTTLVMRVDTDYEKMRKMDRNIHLFFLCSGRI